MASRTRNRALGIAALGMAVAAVIVILLSQGGGRDPATPLKEDPARNEQSGDRSQSSPPFKWLATPAAGDRARARRHAKQKARKHYETGGSGDNRVAMGTGKRHESIPRAWPTDRRTPAAPSTPLPPPVAAPAPPGSIPAVAPVPSRPADSPSFPVIVAQPADPPDNVGTPEPVRADVTISHGQIQGDSDHVRAERGHVQLMVRSDELVVVEIEGRKLSWMVPAAGVGLIEFDTLLGKSRTYELELHRRKGVLVLRLDS